MSSKCSSSALASLQFGNEKLHPKKLRKLSYKTKNKKYQDKKFLLCKTSLKILKEKLRYWSHRKPLNNKKFVNKNKRRNGK